MSPTPAFARGLCSARRLRRLPVLGLLAVALLASLLASAASAQQGGAVVEVLEVRGIVDGTVADFVEEVVDSANEAGAEVVVLQLDVHGALGDAGERVVDALRGSGIPVVVWVGPGGSRATGAGLHIAFAAHVLAAAPGTLLGMGSPTDLAAADSEGVAADDERALLGLAETAGRDGGFVRAAVQQDRVVAVAPAGAPTALPPDAALPDDIDRGDVEVVTEEELAERGLVDVVASSLPDVLLELDGREVALAGGDVRPLDLETVTATVRFNNLGIVRQMLHAAANPTFVYLLLIGGALALAFEVFQPGFGVSGITGVVLMAYGVYGLVVLPVSWLAFAVLLVGLALLAADLAIGRLGVLSLVGTVALAAGSLWLFQGPEALGVPVWVIVVVVIGTVVYFVGVLTTVLRAQGNQAMAGAETVVGKTGVVRSMLNPEGHIFAGGALWRARAPEEAGKVKTGTHVRIIGLNDSLTLDVEPIEGPGAVSEEPAPVSDRTV